MQHGANVEPKQPAHIYTHLLRHAHACVLLFKLFKQSPLRKERCSMHYSHPNILFFFRIFSLKHISEQQKLSVCNHGVQSRPFASLDRPLSQCRSKRYWNSSTGSRGATFPPGQEAYPRRSTSRSESCCGGVVWVWFLEVQHNEEIHMYRW